MKSAILSVIVALSLFSQISSAAIYIIHPENSKTYQEIAKKVEKSVTQTLGESIKVVSATDQEPATKNDLLVFVGKNHKKEPESPTIYSFNVNPDNEQKKATADWAIININQPIEKLISTAQKMVVKDYKNKVLFIVSDKNVSAIKKLNELKNKKNIKTIIIGENEVAAKKIEPELTHAAAIVATYDPNIWSGNSARWIIQQAYNYKVPIIGYSKAFLKAGAMVSVYSTAEQIIEETVKQVAQWAKTEKLNNKVTYPDYTIKINENIAKALNFNRKEIIEIGKKQ